jgi:hypothetical protein
MFNEEYREDYYDEMYDEMYNEVPPHSFRTGAWGYDKKSCICPHCHSDHVIAINTKSILCAVVGSIIGGAITGIFAYSNDCGKKQLVAASITGMLSGVAVGIKFGQPSKSKASTEKVLFCTDCLHFFSTEASEV